MDKLDIGTQDITAEYFKLAGTIDSSTNFTFNSQTYKLTDTGSEHEMFEPRADLYANKALSSFNIILEQTEAIRRTEEFYIALFDSMMFSELCFIEGKPIFNSYYSCIFLHNIKLLETDPVLYSFIGCYVYRLNSIFHSIYNSGVNNHEDFAYSHIPFNSFFEENRLFELIAENEKKFKDSSLAVKSKVTREKAVINEAEC